MTEIDPSRLQVVDHSLVQHKLTLMRSVDTPAPLFRQLLRETSMLLAYEALANLPTVPATVETPLGPAGGQQLEDRPGAHLDSSSGERFARRLSRHRSVGICRLHWHVPRPRNTRANRLLHQYSAGSSRARHYRSRPNVGNRGHRDCRDRRSCVIAGASDLRLVCLVAAPEGIARVHAADPDVSGHHSGCRPRAEQRWLHRARPWRCRRPYLWHAIGASTSARRSTLPGGACDSIETRLPRVDWSDAYVTAGSKWGPTPLPDFLRSQLDGSWLRPQRC